MNPIMLKLWIESKKAHIKHSLNMGLSYSIVEATAMILILEQLEDDFNLEQFKEEDYHLENNF